MGEYGEYLRSELRNVNAVVNKIVMTRNYPGNVTLAFLLVEGTTDKNLYQAYVNRSLCHIIVANGKDNVREIMTVLERERFRGVLAIIDADFDVLEGNVPHSPHILTTDTHDLELMLVQSPALEKVLAEFGSEDKIARFVASRGKDIRSLLLDSALPVGYLRWVSLRENLALKFEGVGFEKFVEKETLKVDPLKLIRVVQSRSAVKKPQKPLFDSDVHTKMKQVKDDNYALWHVCCGHDVMAILSFGLRKVIGTKTMEPDLIEACLRLAYEHSYFRQTTLYRSIKQWEAANMPFVVLIQEMDRT